jgi:hypothetical protein
VDLLGLLHIVVTNKVFAAIGVLLFLDVITGVADALYRGDFYLGNLADFLLTRALPYVLVDVGLQLIIIAGLVGVVPNLAVTAVGDAVHAVVVLTLVGKILDNVHSMNIVYVPMALRSMPAIAAKVQP